MQTISQRQFSGPVFEIAVYTQDLLFDKVGQTVEANAVGLLQTVFDLGQLNYDIYFDFPLQDYQERTGVCDEPFLSWNDDVLAGDIPFVAAEANVLLVDGRAGGCANAPGTYPSATAVGVTALENFSYHLSDLDTFGDSGAAAHAFLHELGHTLGSPGPNQSHFGYGFNDDAGARWFRTPTVSGNDLINACDELIEARTWDPTVRYLFYHWCAIEKFETADGLTADPPTEYPPTYQGSLPPLANTLPRPPGSGNGNGGNGGGGNGSNGGGNGNGNGSNGGEQSTAQRVVEIASVAATLWWLFGR